MWNQSAEGTLLVGADARSLSGEWTLAPSAPNEIAEPGQLHAHRLSWTPARVPCTVAQALAAAKRWDLDDEDDFDAPDWWFRTSFDATPDRAARQVLCFGGLATIAEVWLNGTPVLHTSNMFESYEVSVGHALRERNELVICFRSLSAALARRRGRPRWKTKLVRQQQLRWARTTLLGRIPGWTPTAAPVGPWRPITLETRSDGTIWDASIRSSVAGSNGRVAFAARAGGPRSSVGDAAFVVGDTVAPVLIEDDDDGELRLSCNAMVPAVELWWPHTHGEPRLYRAWLRMTVHGAPRTIDLGAIGFREVDLIDAPDRFELRVNGESVFCRGACWVPTDAIGLSASEAELRRALATLRDAGANMVRVGGTMVYESDAFYRICDELGLMVWQDFMFANMDYPADDDAFAESVRREARQQLRRLARHACMTVYCGNSEVEQQAAMLGVSRDTWRNSLFAEVLPILCRELHPGVPYVPSTPSGGVLPFQTSTGLTHYYGVGAYLRPFTDVRRADVKFTPECLGFANVPEPELVDQILDGDPPAIHDPRWKKRTPRDTGAGWDFEDVRDHYMRELFAVDPQRLRYSDTRRYLELARVASGEAMARAFAEWRRTGSACRGALVWFYRDLWPGAGWGIVDSRGTPKACYYYLRRTWQPLALFFTDEGLNGLRVHVANEQRVAWSGTLDVILLRESGVIIAECSRPCTIESTTTSAFDADDLLGGFYDTAYAYRFGPPAFDIAAAALRDDAGGTIATAIFTPTAFEPRPRDANVRVRAAHVDDEWWSVRVSSEQLLYAAHLDLNGFVPDDNYFHVLPGREVAVRLRRTGAIDQPRGYLEAINLATPARVEVGK